MALIPLAPITTDTGPPSVLLFPIPAGASALDMTTVTGVQFKVARPDGSKVTWVGSVLQSGTLAALIAAFPANIYGPNFPAAWGTVGLTALMAQYPFQVGDVAQVGMYSIHAYLLLPGGGVPVVDPNGNAAALPVVDPNQL